MILRQYSPSQDRARIRELHERMGFDYVFPNFDHPEFFSRLVITDGEGRVSMAIMGRVSAEMFLLFDQEAGNPARRLENFLILHQASEQDMRSKGVQDCFAQIPPGPRMEKFKRLLRLMGWVPADTWQNWTKPQLEREPELPEALKQLVKGNGLCLPTQKESQLKLAASATTT